MKKNKKGHYSGIGGQAVLEGVMMRNKDDYAVAIRKPNGEIEVEVDVFRGCLAGSKLTKIPFIRGVFNFIDSLRLGMKTLNYSASFYEDEEAGETKLDKALDKVSGGKGEKVLMGITTLISVALAVGIFILLPSFIRICEKHLSFDDYRGWDPNCDLFDLYCGNQPDEGYPQAVSVSWCRA